MSVFDAAFDREVKLIRISLTHGEDMSHRGEERVLTGGEFDGDAVVSLSLQVRISCATARTE